MTDVQGMVTPPSSLVYTLLSDIQDLNACSLSSVRCTRILATSSAGHQAGHHPRYPLFCNYDSARLGITITACEPDKHITTQHAEERLGESRVLVNAQLTSQVGLPTRQAATSSWGLNMGRGNYHDLLGHPRRFRFTEMRCVDYASLKQASQRLMLIEGLGYVFVNYHQ
jgi:hypothetical protein